MLSNQCLFPKQALREKGSQGKIHGYTGQQPGTKSDRRPADKPRMNLLSTAGFVPPSVYIGCSSFVLPNRRWEQCLRFFGGQKGWLSSLRTVPLAFRSTRCRPASPLRRAPPRLWYVRVCESSGFENKQIAEWSPCWSDDIIAARFKTPNYDGFCIENGRVAKIALPLPLLHTCYGIDDDIRLNFRSENRTWRKFFRSSWSKVVEDKRIFDLRDRRTKMRGFSNCGFEERWWEIWLWVSPNEARSLWDTIKSSSLALRQTISFCFCTCRI